MASGEWPLQPSHPSTVPLPAVPVGALCGHRSGRMLSWAGAGAVAASSQVVASALTPPAGLVLPAGRALVWTRLLATDPRAQKGSKGLRNVSTTKALSHPISLFLGMGFFLVF